MAFPRPFIERNDAWLTNVLRVVEEEGVDAVVVGLPTSLSGGETASTDAAREVLAAVKEALPDIDVVTIDERLSTVSAAKQLTLAGASQRQQRGKIDSAAAVFILQGFLDATS
jgi:putative Holliday junction resolvase